MLKLRQLRCGLIVCAFLAVSLSSRSQSTTSGKLCLDGFCIGQSINDSHFDDVNWLVPKDAMKLTCAGISCKPEVAFRGYPSEDQKQLADALSLEYYPLMNYNLVTKTNLAALRRYRYECNLSPRGIYGERRFLGIYQSKPSGFETVIGLRLINGGLSVYRIARRFAYHLPAELIALARMLRNQYGDGIVLYDGDSSNAYSDVIAQRKNGWFGRNGPFNPNDPSDNAAEFVLIDPNTRSLLEPTSMPESGEIKPLPVRMPGQCSEPVSIQ